MVQCSMAKGIGYLQCPPDYRVTDPQLTAMTAGTLMGALVRLTGGFSPSSQKWSRTRVSAQLSKNLEIGWAHFPSPASSTTARVVSGLAKSSPQVFAAAWGTMIPNSTDRRKVEDYLEMFRGITKQPNAVQLAFINGWNAAGQTQAGQHEYTSVFYNRVIVPALALMQKKGWVQKKTLAAAVRMRNSSRRWLTKLAAATGDESSAVESVMQEYQGARSSRKNDMDRVRSWPDFKGVLEGSNPSPADLNYSGLPAVVSSPTAGFRGTSPATAAFPPGSRGIEGPTSATTSAVTGSGPLPNGSLAKETPWLEIGLGILGVLGLGGLGLALAGGIWYANKKKGKRRRKR